MHYEGFSTLCVEYADCHVTAEGKIQWGPCRLLCSEPNSGVMLLLLIQLLPVWQRMLLFIIKYDGNLLIFPRWKGPFRLWTGEWSGMMVWGCSRGDYTCVLICKQASAGFSFRARCSLLCNILKATSTVLNALSTCWQIKRSNLSSMGKWAELYLCSHLH